MGERQEYFISYITKSIYLLYFSNTQKVKIVRDLKFIDFEEDDNLQEAC